MDKWATVAKSFVFVPHGLNFFQTYSSTLSFFFPKWILAEFVNSIMIHAVDQISDLRRILFQSVQNALFLEQNLSKNLHKKMIKNGKKLYFKTILTTFSVHLKQISWNSYTDFALEYKILNNRYYLQQSVLSVKN